MWQTGDSPISCMVIAGTYSRARIFIVLNTNTKHRTTWICALLFCLSACAAVQTDPVVVIDAGRLQGTVVDGVAAFRGIPFAAPPVGEWRWRPPQPVTPWEGVRAARDYGPYCAQPQSKLLWFELETISEDCLQLNVWTTALDSNERLPVMVWIHGGGYSQGTGNIPRLNSPRLAKDGVVLVTINYRLAFFGFLVHPALAPNNPGEVNGNYGLLDAIAALEWIKRNIAAFGGDPDNVTIFGESAGAGVVNTLMVMPRAKGLFHRAISQSSSVGLAIDPYPDRRARFQPAAEKAGKAFVEKLRLTANDDIAAALRALSTEELLAAMGERDRFTPVVDGVLLPDQPARIYGRGEQHKVPYMTGGVSWEASLGRSIGGGFSPEMSAKLVPQADKDRLYPGLSGIELEDAIFGDLVVLSGSRYVATAMHAVDVPVFSFYISYQAGARRGKKPGVAHADDIAFVMQTLDTEKDLGRITDRDWEMSKLISSYWIQFAKTGDPNRADLPEWPSFDPQAARVLEIGDEVVVRDKFIVDRLAYHIGRALEMLAKVE
jgi:para-nitrobenzyl esterase